MFIPGLKGMFVLTYFGITIKKINPKNTRFRVHRFATARNMPEMKYPVVYGDFKCLKITVEEIPTRLLHVLIPEYDQSNAA